MKALWIIISTLAIANLLGVAGFVGFLVSTDRLSGPRVQKIREMLSKTTAQEAAEAATEAAKVAEQEKVDAAAKKMAIKPETAQDAIDRVRESDEMTVQRIARLQAEVRQLQEQLDRRQAAIDVDKAAVEAEKKRLAAKQTEVARTLGTEQFKQALASLEAQKPAEAKKVLQALIDQKQTDQAVQYLSAMGERGRNKILGEFIKSDERLAADLLERLRTRGIEGQSSTARTLQPSSP